MSNRSSRSADPLIRLFREVSGDVPDEASVARMHRVSVALNLDDNEALWSGVAMLEYYARLYEAIPERIRWADEGKAIIGHLESLASALTQPFERRFYLGNGRASTNRVRRVVMRDYANGLKV